MAGITVQKIRDTLRRLSLERPGPVTKLELEAEFKICESLERRRLYDALKQMVRRGELKKDGNGYLFVAESSPPSNAEERWQRIYRAVRIAKGSFDIDHISKVTVVPPYNTRSDLNKLVKMGYLTAIKHDAGICYQGTSLLKETPDAPPPPQAEGKVKIGLQKVREAMAELNRLFLTMEVDAAGSRKQIKRQLTILNEEFK